MMVYQEIIIVEGYIYYSNRGSHGFILEPTIRLEHNETANLICHRKEKDLSW